MTTWPPADGTPYMPSNGTEGIEFMDRQCCPCAKYRSGSCGILGRSYIGRQPRVWTWQDGLPKCAAFRSHEEERLRLKGHREDRRQLAMEAQP